MDESERELRGWLERYPQRVRTLAVGLRTFLREETQPSYELVGDSAQSLNIGYGFTVRAWDCFCAIIIYRKHINLSFPSGVALADPAGLLHGTGTRIRHLKLTALKDLQTPAARAILQEARELALSELKPEEASDHEGVKTVIKRRRK